MRRQDGTLSFTNRSSTSRAQPRYPLNSSFKPPKGIRLAVSMTPQPSPFAPLLFAGRLAEGIKSLAKLRFAAVEISLRQTDELNFKWLAKRLSELGLSVSAIATGRMFLEDSLCLCDTNPIVRQQLAERLTGMIQLAAQLHTSVIIGGVRGKLTGDEAHRTEQKNTARETLIYLADQASASGVDLLLEPINRYETNFINTASEGLDFIELVGNPHLKLLLDTFHMNIEEADPCKSMRMAGKYLGYVHIADSNRQAPGRGHIDFASILAVLLESGYQGFITAEILPIPDDARALLQTSRYFHALWDKN